MRDREETATINEITANKEFTVRNSERHPTANENFVKVKTLER